MVHQDNAPRIKTEYRRSTLSCCITITTQVLAGLAVALSLRFVG